MTSVLWVRHDFPMHRQRCHLKVYAWNCLPSQSDRIVHLYESRDRQPKSPWRIHWVIPKPNHSLKCFVTEVNSFYRVISWTTPSWILFQFVNRIASCIAMKTVSSPAIVPITPSIGNVNTVSKDRRKRRAGFYNSETTIKCDLKRIIGAKIHLFASWYTRLLFELPSVLILWKR